jgi:hypothetical protein
MGLWTCTWPYGDHQILLTALLYPWFFPLVINTMPSRHAMHKGKWAHCPNSIQSYAYIYKLFNILNLNLNCAHENIWIHKGRMEGI